MLCSFPGEFPYKPDAQASEYFLHKSHPRLRFLVLHFSVAARTTAQSCVAPAGALVHESHPNPDLTVGAIACRPSGTKNFKTCDSGLYGHRKLSKARVQNQCFGLPSLLIRLAPLGGEDCGWGESVVISPSLFIPAYPAPSTGGKAVWTASLECQTLNS